MNKRLFITLFGMLLLTSCGESLVGKPAPDFKARTVFEGKTAPAKNVVKIGDEFQLAKQSGDPIIMYFFASW